MVKPCWSPTGICSSHVAIVAGSMRWPKKWWFACVVFFLLLGLSATTALIYLLQTRITQANYDRIHDGMTLAEVEEILGKAQKAHTGGQTHFYLWINGPNWIDVRLTYGRAYAKFSRFGSTSELIHWHLSHWLRRIGFKTEVGLLEANIGPRDPWQTGFLDPKSSDSVRVFLRSPRGSTGAASFKSNLPAQPDFFGNSPRPP